MAKETYVSRATLCRIADLCRNYEAAGRRCEKEWQLRYAKELRRIAAGLRESGAEVSLRRATESGYLYGICRRMLQEKGMM